MIRHWNEINIGDVVVRDGRENTTVVSTDVRQSVNVVKLDNGEALRVWRRGPGSVITVEDPTVVCDGVSPLVSSLRELFDLMKADHPSVGPWDNLPTFGGADPRNTAEVWSWNETHAIVGTCSSDINIESRDELEEAS